MDPPSEEKEDTSLLDSTLAGCLLFQLGNLLISERVQNGSSDNSHPPCHSVTKHFLRCWAQIFILGMQGFKNQTTVLQRLKGRGQERGKKVHGSSVKMEEDQVMVAHAF